MLIPPETNSNAHQREYQQEVLAEQSATVNLRGRQ